MITFKSNSDLSKLDPDDPAYPVMKELIELLIDAYTTPEKPYDPDAYGYLALVEDEDADKVIDLPELQCTLLDVLWEGASMRNGYFYAIYLTNNEFGDAPPGYVERTFRRSPRVRSGGRWLARLTAYPESQNL